MFHRSFRKSFVPSAVKTSNTKITSLDFFKPLTDLSPTLKVFSQGFTSFCKLSCDQASLIVCRLNNQVSSWGIRKCIVLWTIKPDFDFRVHCPSKSATQVFSVIKALCTYSHRRRSLVAMGECFVKCTNAWRKARAHEVRVQVKWVEGGLQVPFVDSSRFHTKEITPTF